MNAGSVESGESPNRVTRTSGCTHPRLVALLVSSEPLQVTWSSQELWERIGGVSLIKNGQECSKALWEPIETRTRTFLCQAASWWLGPRWKGQWVSASKFRDVTNNGTVNSSDDFEKNQQQCFLVQLLKIKFIVGQGEAFFKERKGGLKGCFHLPLLPIWTGKRNGLLESLARPRESPVCWCWGPSQTFFIIHAYMQTKYLRNC